MKTDTFDSFYTESQTTGHFLCLEAQFHCNSKKAINQHPDFSLC